MQMIVQVEKKSFEEERQFGKNKGNFNYFAWWIARIIWIWMSEM